MDIDKLTAETKRCLIGWRVYERDLIRAGLDGPLRTTAVGWKVTGLREFSKATQDLLPLSEQVHIGTVNERFIGSFILKEPLSADDIPIIKVLQLRPGSNDPIGLDHIDFYVKDLVAAKKILAGIKANWEEQSNDVHSWLSVRFGEVLEYEAKFVDHTVLTATVTEMQQAEKRVLDR